MDEEALVAYLNEAYQHAYDLPHGYGVDPTLVAWRNGQLDALTALAGEFSLDLEENE